MASFIRTKVVFNGADEAVKALARLQNALGAGDFVTALGRGISTEMERVLTRLTPTPRTRNRQPPTARGFPQLRRQWETVVTEHVPGLRFHAVVQNRATLSAAGAIVMLALEGGAKPHEIDPVRAKALSWNSPSVRREYLGRFTRKSDGATVERERITRRGQRTRVYWPGSTATGVMHPGHKPFRMVAKAEQQLNYIVGPVTAVFAAEIERMWSGAGLSGFGTISAGVTRVPASFNPINLAARRSTP